MDAPPTILLQPFALKSEHADFSPLFVRVDIPKYGSTAVVVFFNYL
jgi:hypothetical protein